MYFVGDIAINLVLKSIGQSVESSWLFEHLPFPKLQFNNYLLFQIQKTICYYKNNKGLNFSGPWCFYEVIFCKHHLNL